MRESCFRRIPLAVLPLVIFLPLSASPTSVGGSASRLDELTREIPARSLEDLTGSQFVRSVSSMTAPEREQAILTEISKGNLPEFLRKLVPVELRCDSGAGKNLVATIFVTPDYLAIGSDSDFLRIPMNLHTAATIAERFGFVLPTRKMVDAIYLQSRYHLVPQRLVANRNGYRDTGLRLQLGDRVHLPGLAGSGRRKCLHRFIDRRRLHHFLHREFPRDLRLDGQAASRGRIAIRRSRRAILREWLWRL